MILLLLGGIHNKFLKWFLPQGIILRFLALGIHRFINVDFQITPKVSPLSAFRLFKGLGQKDVGCVIKFPVIFQILLTFT